MHGASRTTMVIPRTLLLNPNSGKTDKNRVDKNMGCHGNR